VTCCRKEKKKEGEGKSLDIFCAKKNRRKSTVNDKLFLLDSSFNSSNAFLPPQAKAQASLFFSYFQHSV
jgi:hypothetical protein